MVCSSTSPGRLNDQGTVLGHAALGANPLSGDMTRPRRGTSLRLLKKSRISPLRTQFIGDRMIGGGA